jgi:hypothetical protein
MNEIRSMRCHEMARVIYRDRSRSEIDVSGVGQSSGAPSYPGGTESMKPCFNVMKSGNVCAAM